MQDMMEFSVFLLQAVADFIASPPVFYLFGLICFCFIAKFIMILIGRRY